MLLLKTDHINTYILVEVSGRFPWVGYSSETWFCMAFFLPRLLLHRVLVIHTEGRALLIHILFENTVSFARAELASYFLLFVIAKGIAMCRLRGVISAQIVLF